MATWSADSGDQTDEQVDFHHNNTCMGFYKKHQNSRRQYEQYVCKRIPGKQAVVVMACDNTHISDDMILEPGLVMIFAHGIE